MENNLADTIAMLKNISFFSVYDDTILSQIAAKMSLMTFPAGTMIFEAGTEADRLYVVKKGMVRVFKDDMEIALLGVGKFFGEIGLITSEKRTASIQAVEDTETIILNKKDFDDLIQQGLFKDDASRGELFHRIRENFSKGI